MNYPGEVDLAPFRSAFAGKGVSIQSVARSMGADEAQVARLLTNRVHVGARGRRREGFTRCRYGTALRLCEALGLDPIDVGL